MTTTRGLAGRRALASGLDAVGYLGIAAALVPLGVVLARRGREVSRFAVEAMSTIPPVTAAIWAAAAEATDGRTWGKRRLGLRVRTTRGQPTFVRMLVRNVAKTTVPWQLGHMVAIGAAEGGFERGEFRTVASTVATYVMVAAFAVTVLTGSGRGIHDRIAGTRVEATKARRHR